MKVICINAGHKPNSLINGGSANELVEGRIYTVIKVFAPLIDEEGYLLEEIKSCHPLGAFLASRFAPLSQIDETEMTRENLNENNLV